MSNYLAIATVTAALQRLLQNALATDVPGAIVTTIRPDTPSGGTMPTPTINLYLYQVTPNPAWRNADLRTRRPKGDLIKKKLLGWDLHYIMTFYGNETQLEPQRLLGSTVRTLIDCPTLTHDFLRSTYGSARANYPFLADSDLDEQVELVQLIPSAITTEDLSRIWSVFFQIPYALSLPYQATAVLIEGDAVGRRELPIGTRQVFVTPERPQIEELAAQTGDRSPVTLQPRSSYISFQETLIIRGQQLQGGNTKVQIGEAQLTPQTVSDTEIRLSLSALSPEEANHLRAGVQGVKVLRICDLPLISNTIPIVVYPTITADNIEAISQLEENEEGGYNAEISVPVNVMVDRQQRVYLFLNSITCSEAYIFRKSRNETDSSNIVFHIKAIQPGDYLVRVQIDDAESRLHTGDDANFISPLLRLPPSTTS
jgi:Pvc16 N-terminal domain